MIFSYEALTSRAVSSLPSWNFTPRRILNVHVRPFAPLDHDSARSPTILVPDGSAGSTLSTVL